MGKKHFFFNSNNFLSNEFLCIHDRKKNTFPFGVNLRKAIFHFFAFIQLYLAICIQITIHRGGKQLDRIVTQTIVISVQSVEV